MHASAALHSCSSHARGGAAHARAARRKADGRKHPLRPRAAPPCCARPHLQVRGHILPRHALHIHHRQDALGHGVLQALQGARPAQRAGRGLGACQGGSRSWGGQARCGSAPCRPSLPHSWPPGWPAPATAARRPSPGPPPAWSAHQVAQRIDEPVVQLLRPHQARLLVRRLPLASERFAGGRRRPGAAAAHAAPPLVPRRSRLLLVARAGAAIGCSCRRCRHCCKRGGGLEERRRLRRWHRRGYRWRRRGHGRGPRRRGGCSGWPRGGVHGQPNHQPWGWRPCRRHCSSCSSLPGSHGSRVRQDGDAKREPSAGRGQRGCRRFERRLGAALAAHSMLVLRRCSLGRLLGGWRCRRLLLCWERGPAAIFRSGF